MENADKEHSINDSGYSPSMQTSPMTELNESDERADISPPTSARLVPLRSHPNLIRFEKPTDEAMQHRFDELTRGLEGLILTIKPKPRKIAIRPFYGGVDESNIHAYVVIFCQDNLRKRIEDSINSSGVREMCEAPGLPHIKLLVEGGLQLKHSQSDIKVCRNKETTLCGTQILHINKSKELGSDGTRKSTVGGIIQLKFVDGTSKLYGFTAGHVIDDWQNDSTDTGENTSSMAYEESLTHELAQSNNPPPNDTLFKSHGVLSGAWDFSEHDEFGEVLDAKNFSGLENIDVRPCHDWALFKTKAIKPNELCAQTSSGNFERRELRKPARPPFNDGLSDPVIMIGGSKGPVRGELSIPMGRILIGSSNKFVDAYMLKLNDGNKIHDGDSGSWVVHSASPLLYGHVVAEDIFEDAYVIPMVDTLEEIKRCFGAVSVELPTAKDIEDFENNKLSTAQHPIAENADLRIVTALGSVGADCDDLDIFSTSVANQYQVEVIKGYCGSINLSSYNVSTDSRKIVWIDDRTCGRDQEGADIVRKYENPLTAGGLLQALQKPRFGGENLPDAQRRLIYITDLSPSCIYALLITASCLEISALMDAIYNYLAFETAIAVKIPSDGFPTFQLKLHIPFFLLRDTPPELGELANKRPRREWTDLSFLRLPAQSQHSEIGKKWGIYEAQISCVVSGWDDDHWVSYGFVDAEIDGYLDGSSQDDLGFDQIADRRAEASRPIWNPRDYWVKILEIRSEQVRMEWERLIYHIGLAVKQHKNEYRYILSGHSKDARKRTRALREALDWTLKIKDLLRRMNGVLEDTTEAWNSFRSSQDHDIDYIRGRNSESNLSHPSRSLHNVAAAFKEIQKYKSRVDQHCQFCTELSRVFELYLLIESKETAKYDSTTSEFTVSVIYPIALAAAFFSMQPEVIPLDLSPRTFALTVIVVITLTFATRFVIRQTLSHRPSWRGTTATLMRKLDRGNDGSSKNAIRDMFASMRRASPGRAMGDEEKNTTGVF